MTEEEIRRLVEKVLRDERNITEATYETRKDVVYLYGKA